MFWFDCDCHVLRYVTHCIWLNPLVCVRALALDCEGTQRLTTEMPLARTQSSLGHYWAETNHYPSDRLLEIIFRAPQKLT